MQHRSLKTDEREILRLVERSKQGDEEAFAKLYDRFFQPLYRYMYYRVDADAVEDLIETVFLKIWRNIHTFEDKKVAFQAWVFRIAHNVLVDFYRAHQPVYEIPESYADSRKEASSTHAIENRLHQENLKRALSKVNESYQRIILLKFVNELSNQEIAQILEKTENSVRILQFRALKALKQELNQMGVTDYF